MTNIGDLLRFDPLSAAEKLTGKDYHDDKGTAALGFLMHMDHSERKAAALKAAQDTHWGISFDDALRVFESEGFTIVYDVPYRIERDDDARDERHVILWNPLGVLLDATSYMTTQLNSGKMYYVIRFNEGTERWSLTSSGQGVDDPLHPDDKSRYVWAGDHDVREGFRHNFRGLADNGTFLNPWPKRPWLWLLHYGQDSDKYNEINAQVIASLPDNVQSAIGLPQGSSAVEPEL